jgi:putative ABC transport system permease protein
MFRNYVITAIRNISRNLGYSFINFIGLSIGIALFILIMLFVQDEYSFDKFNTNYDRIYRFEGGDAEWVHLPSAMGPDAQQWFPEIEQVVRFKSVGNFVLKNEMTTFNVPNVMLADSSFFNVFTTEFILGNKNTAFNTPNSIVLTEKMARIFFGNEDPINKTLKTTNDMDLVVMGVIKDFPNFHLQIDILVPFTILGVMNGPEYLHSYGTWQFQTYFLLPRSFDNKNLETKLEDKYTELWGNELKVERVDLTIRPLKDVYFTDYSKADFGAAHGNRNTVKLFFAIGIFIILIACINFINLTTAKASKRATEVGIRKVHGGYKHQLITQFLSESILITFISYLLAVTLVQLFLPFYNSLIQKNLSLLDYVNPWFFAISLGGIILTGVLAGIYPAFYLTAFSPIKVLKGEKTKGKSAIILRRLLIVLQFTISVALIVSTITVQKQLNYLRNADMGFKKEQILAIDLNASINKQKDAFKQKLLSHPEIVSVSFSAGIIGTMGNTESFDFNSDGEETSIQLHSIDPAFLDLYEIELIEGRNISFDNTGDQKQKIILNEEAVKAGGLELGKAAGTVFHRDGWYFTALPSKECEVIGVVKNFHYRSLHDAIGPQGLCWNEDWHGTINIKIQPENISSTLKIIEQTFKEFSPEIPYEFTFIDDHINNLYRSDKRIGQFFIYFSIIAIIIAILGLFGLAAYIAESRTKEIGIRKVLGSTASNIVLILSKEFLKWVLLANLFAAPIAYYGMNKWLQTFAYKTNITPAIFILSLLISLVIAIMTVFYQANKAARQNPITSLRYE